MPTPKSGPALFLGIELSTDQLRASIVDESLELVGVESVDFDTELPEFHTQGGIFTTPGDAYTTPIEMWIKGLDSLLKKLASNHDLSRIKSIGGAAHHALVWWKSTTVPSLSSLDPNIPFHSHFSAHTFSLPNTPIAQDTASHSHALMIENILGGPERMAARVGTAATPSMVSAQLLRVRETWQQEVWARTGRVQLASAFLCSLLAGKWIQMGEAEACATGMWVHGGPGTQGHWDEGILDIVGGSREEGRRVRGWLGDVDTSGGGRRAGNVSRYLVERYRFDPETIVSPFTTDYLASYLSLCPSPSDAVLSFGPMDMLLTPAQHYLPTRLYNLFPHPAQDSNEKRRYIALLCSRNADVPRALVRDMYTKSWSAFDRLVAIVPPGGSIGLDDKLFSFWHLQADAHPYSHVKGIYRFETGIKVNEFRDLRANPRCLVESQILAFRVKWSRMLATGVLGSPRKPVSSQGGAVPPASSSSSSSATAGAAAGAGVGTGTNQTPPPPFIGRSSTPSTSPLPPTINAATSSLGLSFDPYDSNPLPARVICTGAAANFPSISNIAGDVFNAPVFVPNTQVDSAQVVPHRNAPVQGYPSRGALGGAYMARWVWGREVGMGGLGVFEDEIRRLLQKRWVASGGVPVRTNINGAVVGTSAGVGGSMGGGLLSLVSGVAGMNVGGGVGGGGGTGGSGANSGTSTPFGSRSGVGATVFEEEEDELLERASGYGFGGMPHHDPAILSLGAASGGSGGGGGGGFGSTSGSMNMPAAAYAAPDINLSLAGLNLSPGLGSGAASNGQTTPGGGQQAGQQQQGQQQQPTPLTPVVALPTSDAEAQIGLSKVAESDPDAFLTYAAIVPEYSRLEGLLVKGIV